MPTSNSCDPAESIVFDGDPPWQHSESFAGLKLMVVNVHLESVPIRGSDGEKRQNRAYRAFSTAGQSGRCVAETLDPLGTFGVPVSGLDEIPAALERPVRISGRR